MRSNKLIFTQNTQPSNHNLYPSKPVVFGRHFPNRKVVIRNQPPSSITPVYKGRKTESDFVKFITLPVEDIIEKETPNILLTINDKDTRK